MVQWVCKCMERHILEEIINAGNQAPSGGNSQSWRFIVSGNTINLVAIPEMDHRVYNFSSRGTYVAHGALIENMTVAAANFGYKTSIELMPAPNVSATLSFTPDNDDHRAELYDAIHKRHSNRKPYSQTPISETMQSYVFADSNLFPICRLETVSGSQIQEVTDETALDVAISLENHTLHGLLFHEVLWDEADQLKRGGLFVKTLEMVPPASIIFGLLKYWPIAKIFGWLGLFSKIHNENAKKAGSAALVGAIIVPNDDKAFISAGQFLENIWLRATKQGLSMSLMTGVTFLWQHANLSSDNVLTQDQTTRINQAYDNLKKFFKANNNVIAVVFRIGEAPEPLAVALKRKPIIEWKHSEKP